MNKLSNELLIEKYRPTILSEIVGQDKIVNKLKDYVINRNIPNLLFAGFQGTGKTTASIALARELYGQEWKSNFLELNSSDENGIDIIRGKIKNYAGIKSMGRIPFKIILLDEADNLTNPAQAALRRTMEKYTSTCRFILSCNYSSKIISPIQSRTSVFRFKKLSKDDIINQLIYISKKESIQIESTALEAISYISEGDLRKAIGILDTARNLNNKIITLNDIYDISNLIDPHITKELVAHALKRDFFGALTIIEQITLNGLSSTDILKSMMKEVLEMNIPDKLKVDIVSIIGECDWRTSEGTNESIAMKWMIANIIKLGS